MNETFYTSAYSENVEARFEDFQHTRMCKDPETGKLERRTFDEIICRSRIKGDADESTHRMKAHNEAQLKRDFPAAWAAYEGTEAPDSEVGFPIEDLFVEADEKPIARRLRQGGVRTVNHLARLPENIARSICGMDWVRHQRRAKEFLDRQYAPHDEAAGLSPEQRATFEAMKKEILARMKSDAAPVEIETSDVVAEDPIPQPVKRKPGRPKKEAA